jgi:hypothetical protein
MSIGNNYMIIAILQSAIFLIIKALKTIKFIIFDNVPVKCCLQILIYFFKELNSI